MKCVPFRPADFYAVPGPELITEDNEWLIELQYKHGLARTIFPDNGNIPVCCFGVVIVLGVGSIWMRVQPNPPIFIHRHIKRAFRDFQRETNIQRLETVISKNALSVNHRFISRLGFVIDGSCEKFFPDGSGGVRWAWVRN